MVLILQSVTLDGKHISALPNDALHTVCFIATTLHMDNKNNSGSRLNHHIPYATHAHAQYNKSKLFSHVLSYLNVHLLRCHCHIFSCL